MDLKESITTAMEEINRRRQVTSNDNESTDTADNLSKEERDFYQLMFGDDIASVRYRKLHCTACDKHIGSAPAEAHNMYAHPILLTLLCENCYKFYGDGNFEQGEDSTDMFCRWCANGGNLYCCSYCSNTFCNKCIKRNCDPLIRRKIEDEEKWKCFVCDPTDLYTARAVCWALLQHVKTVTRILTEDKSMPKDEFTRKMNLDECKCCVRRRKAKRRRLSGIESDDDDETYDPSLEEASLSLRRSASKKSLRRSSVTNGDLDNTAIKIQPPDADGFDDDDLPPPMIPCVQMMEIGDSSETLNETLNSQAVGEKESPSTRTPPPLHINPIPTASLMKVAPPVSLTPLKSGTMKRKRAKTLQHILPAPATQFLMVKKSPQSAPNPNVHTIEYSSLPLRAPTGVPLQPNVPMVAIPATGTKTFKPTVRVLHKVKSPFSSAAPAPPKEVRVIELDSDSDDHTTEQTNSGDKGSKTLSRNQDILKNMLNKNTPESSTPRFPEPIFKKKSDKTNRVEDEIDMKTEEVRMLFRMIGTKLKKVPLLHLPNHNKLRSTRVKTRRFHLAIAKAITTLSDINDKVVHTYSSWRTSMLLGSRQTRSNDFTPSSQSKETVDVEVPLDMICTNSDTESDNETYDSDEMFSTDKLRSFKSFQERDTVDVGVGESVTTADKSVQVYDVVDRDYEKCIGHSVLTKVVYDPVDGSEILKPVIVPAENEGKFEEQFIFYLQHREENQVETDDDLGLPDPNETPLKDLIEANSPFVLEMLESIADSPLANGIIPSESVTEASDESGKENEESIEPTNVVKELAKIVTELSEDLKTTNNKTDETNLANKNNCENENENENENSKKDRRKQVFQDNKMEHEEVDIAVQTLIEEDERSRSSSNDDEATSRTVKQLRLDGKTSGIGYSEDECTIID